ncbi:hypothetical protein DIPPA_24551 [Diplonema papillatum]|nr:hypothetical protein DIPPA_24551 [Diplonema papillatum]
MSDTSLCVASSASRTCCALASAAHRLQAIRVARGITARRIIACKRSTAPGSASRERSVLPFVVSADASSRMLLVAVFVRLYCHTRFTYRMGLSSCGKSSAA